MNKLALGAFVGALLAFVAAHTSNGAAPPMYFGLYGAVVTSNTDPLQASRLRLEIDALPTKEQLWAVPCVAYTGGAAPLLPPVGTHVWVAFQAGNPGFPVWTGWRP